MKTGGNAGGSAAGTGGTNGFKEGYRPAGGLGGSRGPAGKAVGSANREQNGSAAGPDGLAVVVSAIRTGSDHPLHPLMDYKEVAATLGLSVPRARLWCRRHSVALLQEGRWVRVVRASLLETIARRIVR